jgi:hypothetical protein
MQAISIDELIKWMDKLEDLNGNNAASCWLSLKMSLDILQEQAAQQSAQDGDTLTDSIKEALNSGDGVYRP